MTNLRWALLALGILVIAAIYLWSQGIPQRWLAPLAALRKERRANSVRVEPEIGDSLPEELDDPEPEAEPERPVVPDEPAETIVTLRLIPNEKEIACNKVILALRAAGLKHGRYGIFHRQLSDVSDEPKFSVAN
jgi:FtsZ-interacting cell division protein ZipA